MPSIRNKVVISFREMLRPSAQYPPHLPTHPQPDKLTLVTTYPQNRHVEQIHASGKRLVLAVTGGGSGAISALLQVPGASASVLEAIVPYSAPSMQDWLSGAIDQFCSEKTARAMAMRAFERARELSSNELHALLGVGATASLASNRPKRGPHRIHVAWQSAAATAVLTYNFPKAEGTRTDEEQVSTQLILRAIGEACELPTPLAIDTSLNFEVERLEQTADASWSELLLGVRRSVPIHLQPLTQPKLLFPGAFNPPHWGHEQMAQIAAERCKTPVTFELSIANVDKPLLDFIELAARLKLLGDRPVLVTRAPTFAEKAQLAPGCTFVVGVDTIERIADPAYYHGDTAQRDAAISEIATRGCRFLVFGRRLEGRFVALSAVNVPPSLRALCDEVPETEFTADVSSTALRATASE